MDSEQSMVIPLRRFLILTFGSVGMLAGLVFPFPMSGRYWNSVFDLAHAPAFFLIFVLVSGVLDPTAIGLPERYKTLLPLTSPRLLILSGFIFCGGVACEVAQKFVSRHPSIHDIIANAAGLVAGTVYCLSRRSNQWWRRNAALIAAVPIILAPSLSPIQELTEYLRQRQEFPRIASFERIGELGAWDGHGASIQCDSTWSSDGNQSMLIQSFNQNNPGAVMVWPIPDWSNYSTLKFDLYNPETSTLLVGVTISDEQHVHNLWEPSDRFNLQLEVLPREQKTVSISLADVANSPVSRKMDLTRVSNFNIFMPAAPIGAKLHVDHAELIK